MKPSHPEQRHTSTTKEGLKTIILKTVVKGEGVVGRGQKYFFLKKISLGGP